MRLPACALMVALLVSPGSAEAFDALIRLDAELGYAGYAVDVDGETKRVHGAGSALDISWGFNEFLAVRGGYGWGVHRGRGAFETQTLSLGGRYLLDVFEYIPWFEMSLGLYLTDGDDGLTTGVTNGVITGFGIDRLLDPDWSIGAAVRYHQIVGEERYPSYFTLSLRLGYRWTFGDPLAP